jgi:FAD:protein FMN transferase
MDEVHRFRHTAMATQYEIRCCHPDAAYARQAAVQAFALVDRLELQLSRFVENSDITRINHLSPGESTVVGLETMQCLRLADAAWRETGGAFDVSLGSGFDRLEIVPEAFVVRALADGVSLDLGAIGKGFAVDRVAELLEEWEVACALIDAGFSSALALEPPDGVTGWPLTLSRPGESGDVFERRDVRQAALGASGVRKGDHIIVPFSRAAVRGRAAAWVAAPRDVLGDLCGLVGVDPSPAGLADALSTAFMVMEVADVEAWCRRHPGVEAWILDDELRYLSHAGADVPRP